MYELIHIELVFLGDAFFGQRWNRVLYIHTLNATRRIYSWLIPHDEFLSAEIGLPIDAIFVIVFNWVGAFVHSYLEFVWLDPEVYELVQIELRFLGDAILVSDVSRLECFQENSLMFNSSRWDCYLWLKLLSQCICVQCIRVFVLGPWGLWNDWNQITYSWYLHIFKVMK